MIRYCFKCGKKFNYKGGSNKFCSDKCFRENNKELNELRQKRFYNR